MIMLKFYSLIYSLLILSLYLSTVMPSEGIFEIHIKNYVLQKSLELNKCCSAAEKSYKNCESHCNVFMEICLSIYQEVPHRFECDIGENMIVTDVLGNDKMSASGHRDYSIKVRERWIKNFNILVKIKHRDNDTKNEEIIVTLSSAEENVKPSSDWITKQLSTPKDHFQLLVSFRYSCSEYHYGEMCDKYCKPSHSGVGHYNCSTQGDIICHNGYIGNYCDKVVCQKKCAHGTCTGPNLCRCFTGWIGDSCDKCLPYPGCVNGGCRLDEKGTDLLPLTCDCQKGWGGMFCNIDLNYCSKNPNVCLNGGECQNFGNINTNQQYRCICKPGFSGTHCEKSVSNCIVRGCQNNGTCQINGQRNTSICSCKNSFYGDQCQFNMTSCAETPCIGSNSKCYPDSVSGFRCECAVGFIGRNCEIDKDECSTNPCLNGGMCIDRAGGFRCVCPVGFSGNRCQVNKNDCQRLSCMNGARCMDKANRIDCECTEGWTGSICDQNIDECAINQPCVNGGKCEDTAGWYRCTCTPFWTGVHCELRLTRNASDSAARKCLINPCRNNGVCLLSMSRQNNGQNGMAKSIGGLYHCVCPPGFTGPLCNQVIIANGTVASENLSTDSIVSFTDRDRKSQLTLINLIIISVGVPSILVIVTVISLLLCRATKAIGKSNNSIIKGHRFASNANIKILNNKLHHSRHGLLWNAKQNNYLNNMPPPHLSLPSYKCSMLPLMVDNIPHSNPVVTQNPNLLTLNIREEEDRFIDKSLPSIFDRDGEPESNNYPNVTSAKELMKSNHKISFESNTNDSSQYGYKPLAGSNSVLLKRRIDRQMGHGLCSSQNSLVESAINQTLRSAISQQLHQPYCQSYDDNYCEKVDLNHLRNVKQMVSHNNQSGSAWRLNNNKPFSDHGYVLYYTKSTAGHPKINYSLISHPNFRETSCFRDSLKSVKTDSTSVGGNISPQM